MADDPWACFEDSAPSDEESRTLLQGYSDPTGPSQPVSQLITAAMHTDFLWVSSLWPSKDHGLDVKGLISRAGTLIKHDLFVRGPLVCEQLRSDKGSYGADAAKSLQRFLQPCSASEVVIETILTYTVVGAARECDELCAVEMEERGQWEAPCWHLATAFSLGIRILAALAGQGAQASTQDAGCNKPAPRTGDSVSALWMRLFELVAYAGGEVELHQTSESSQESQETWVGYLLLAAETVVANSRGSHVSSPHPATATGVRLPSCLPSTEVAYVPNVDPSRQVKIVRHADGNSSSVGDGLAAALPLITPVDFFSNYFGRKDRPGVPLLIRGYIEPRWDLDRLADLNILQEEYGDRIVPVTFGSLLVGKDFENGIITIRELVEQYLLPSNASHRDAVDAVTSASQDRMTGLDPQPIQDPELERLLPRTAYMSQHQLFHQCPDLLRLITVPAYTMGRKLAPANAWIGTRGTTTRLHSDSGENLLCQVAGFKYVRLYSLDQTPKVYADHLRQGTQNVFGTSPVRVEAPDFDQHPLFAGAEYTETLLQPGDMLYIPDGHWHYIRSLTTSLSVNFWC